MKNVSFVFEDDLSVDPLCDSEKKWIKRLQKVLGECPPRLELVTVGDPSLSIIDIDGRKRVDDLCDGQADEAGIVLANVVGGPIIHGVSG